MTRVRLLWTVVVVLVVSGCGGGDPSSQPSGSGSPAPSESASASPGMPRAVPHDSSASWRELQVRPIHLAKDVELNARYRLVSDISSPGESRPQRTRVFGLSGTKVFEHSAQVPNWHTQDAWLVDDRVIVEDIDVEGREIRLRLFEMPGGRELRIPRAARIAEPEVGVGDGFVSFITGDSAKRMCHQVVEVSSLRLLPQVCGERGETLGDEVVRRGASSFSAVRGADEKDRCKRVVVVRDGQASDVPARQRCLGWSAAVLDDAVAWDEMDPAKPLLSEADGFVLPDGGEVVELGKIYTDSLVACGERFFWTASAGNDFKWAYSWDPSDGVRTVWRDDEIDSFPLLLECTDNRWLTTGIAGLNDETAVVLDTAELE